MYQTDVELEALKVQVRELQADNDRLRTESDAAYEDGLHDGWDGASDEWGKEVERLRAALEEIVILSDDYHKAVPIARAALAPPKQEEAHD